MPCWCRKPWWQYSRMVHFFSLTAGVVVVSKAMHITVLVPAKGRSNITHFPHSCLTNNTSCTELGSSALSLPSFFFLLVYAKASKSFLTYGSAGSFGCHSRCLHLSQHISSPLKEHKFLVIWCFQEEGLMCTFSLATNLGKCPNSPTSLCLSGKVVLGSIATSVSNTVSFKCIYNMLTVY